MNIQLWQRNRI